MAAINILDMFDPGVHLLIKLEGSDRPRNALTLGAEMHSFFEKFDLYFEPFGNQPNVYRICTVSDGIIPGFPLVRSLRSTPSFEAPSPRLLALHKAVALLLNISGAYKYVQRFNRNGEAGYVSADGTTNLEILVTLAMLGYLVPAY